MIRVELTIHVKLVLLPSILQSYNITDTVFPTIVIPSACNLRFQASNTIPLQPLDFLKSRNLEAETFHFYFEISARGNCPEEAAIFFFFQIFAYDYKRDLLHPVIVSLTLFVTFFPGIQSISLPSTQLIVNIVNMDFYANKYYISKHETT